MTFKDAKEISFIETISKIRVLIQELYREHRTLITSEHLDVIDKALFQKYLEGSSTDSQFTTIIIVFERMSLSCF